MSWYYAKEQESVGPIQESDLKALFAENKINGETLVWKEGQPEWISYSSAFAASATAPTAATAVAPAAAQTCVACGKSVSSDEAVQISGNWVCAACKPSYVQKIKEGVEVSGAFRYAGFWIRVGAKIIDGLILYAVQLPLQIVSTMFVQPKSEKEVLTALVPMAIFFIVSMAIHIAYYVFFVGKYGATPGKMVCKIKIVRADGSAVSYGRATGRLFAEFLSAIILYIGYFMVAFDDEKRALHDRICDTRVIYK